MYKAETIKVVVTLSDAERAAQEQKLLDAMLWMVSNNVPFIHRPADQGKDSIRAQMYRAYQAAEKAEGA